MITAEPFHIRVYSKMHLVEMVMALHGRGSPDPRRYRQLLEQMDEPALRRALDEPPDFPGIIDAGPAPEETTDDTTHAKRASGESTPARDFFATDHKQLTTDKS